jgi:hypothetical protein
LGRVKLLQPYFGEGQSFFSHILGRVKAFSVIFWGGWEIKMLPRQKQQPSPHLLMTNPLYCLQKKKRFEYSPHLSHRKNYQYMDRSFTGESMSHAGNI